MRRIDGRRVLIVGASSGIGRGIATTLSAAGASIAIAARRKDRLDEVVAERPSKAIGITCDVTDPDSCEAVVQEAVEFLGGLDCLDCLDWFTNGNVGANLLEPADHGELVLNILTAHRRTLASELVHEPQRITDVSEILAIMNGT
jgi:NAD(P)-dependent dehydrogenase (short-subunit alcohol dehydrogenase family)